MRFDLYPVSANRPQWTNGGTRIAPALSRAKEAAHERITVSTVGLQLDQKDPLLARWQYGLGRAATCAQSFKLS